MTREQVAVERFGRMLLNRLERLQNGSAGAEGLQRFDELWAHVRIAHQRLAARPGSHDDVCAQLPMTALRYWLTRLPAPERRDQLAASEAGAGAGG